MGRSEMHLLDSVRVAIRSLGANKLRGILTMLGVTIGVTAVIALMSLGRGAQAQITDQGQSLGSNLVFINPGAQRQQGIPRAGAGGALTLSHDDATAIREEFGADLLAGVAP